RFVMQGPDFEGQIRRLRSGDGIHFTQSGARKLAHYVEREIQRSLMTSATPVALPVDEPAPQVAAPAPTKPGSAAIARPLAGPVLPLTTAAEADERLGGASARQTAPDPIAARVLVRGEPARVPVGRADDFAWPRRTVLPQGTDPIVATSTTPITPMVPFETRQAAVQPAAAPAQRIGPPAPPRQAATAPAQQQRQTSWFGSWGQPYQQQQQAQQRSYQRTQQPFYFPFFGGR